MLVSYWISDVQSARVRRGQKPIMDPITMDGLIHFVGHKPSYVGKQLGQGSAYCVPLCPNPRVTVRVYCKGLGLG